MTRMRAVAPIVVGVMLAGVVHSMSGHSMAIAFRHAVAFLGGTPRAAALVGWASTFPLIAWIFCSISSTTFARRTWHWQQRSRQHAEE